MDCALWLNRRKIRTAAEIAEEPDIASLRGYFLAGSLVDWLREHEGVQYAKKLEKLSHEDSALNEKLADIFGGSACGHKSFGEGAPQIAADASGTIPCSFSAVLNSFDFGSSGSYNYSAISSFGSSLHSWEFSLGSFLSGSFTSGSGMHEWEWERFFELYESGSFALGSFHEWEWEWLFQAIRVGSFVVGSFNFGSYWRMGSLGSGMEILLPERFDLLDEYDRIMLETLMKCPLDRFGYGIHNI